jgi:hypothetical protein
MLKQDADKEYLATKVWHYLKQGDKVMAERFLEAYLPLVGCAREEIMQLVDKATKKADKIKPKTERKVKDEKEGDE